jgi:hypothetical protein
VGREPRISQRNRIILLRSRRDGPALASLVGRFLLRLLLRGVGFVLALDGRSREEDVASSLNTSRALASARRPRFSGGALAGSGEAVREAVDFASLIVTEHVPSFCDSWCWRDRCCETSSTSLDMSPTSSTSAINRRSSWVSLWAMCSQANCALFHGSLPTGVSGRWKLVDPLIQISADIDASKGRELPLLGSCRARAVKTASAMTCFDSSRRSC